MIDPDRTPEHSSVRGPLSAARHSDSDDRRRMIHDYQAAHHCRLAVVTGPLLPHSVTLFEDLIFDADPESDLHLMLDTLGGDGETSIRLARQAQSRCRELTVIVPDQAKSAGTLLALGAHRIATGPTSELGPIDPQFQLADGAWASAKAIIAAVQHAEMAVQDNPDTFPWHVSMLGEVTALMAQQARDAIARTDDQLAEALASCPIRSAEDVARLAQELHPLLISEPQSHAAVVSASQLAECGLDIEELNPTGDWWRAIWRLWARYFTLGAAVYESAEASHIFGAPPDS